MKKNFEIVNRNITPPVPTGARSSEYVWVTIMLGYDMKGHVAKDEDGQSFVETEFIRLKWTHASAFALSLASAIESAFDLESDTLHLRERVSQKDTDEVQPQVSITASSIRCADLEKLKAIVAAFGEAVTPQLDLLADTHRAQLDQPELAKVHDAARAFLQTNNGQQIQRQMQISVDKEYVTTIKGHWRKQEDKELKPSQEHSIEAFYDGRRLRTRTLYVTQAGARPKAFEIFYDEDKFDQALRDLGDDKHAMLELVAAESWQDSKKSRLDLKSLRRVQVPTELDLLHSGSEAAQD
jgi:hypothetical protein